MKRLLRLSLLLLLTAVVTMAVTYAVVRWRHTVPFNQCSEVYQRYSRFPGVEAAFIRDKQINDTLCLDMTLLVAKDSSTFAGLLNEWGKSDEFITDIMISIVDENTRFFGKIPKGHPELPKAPVMNDNEVIAYFPARKTVAFFHTETESQIDAILMANIFKTFNL